MIIIIILRMIIMLLMLLFFSPTPDLLNLMSQSTEGRIVFDCIAQTYAHSPSNRRTSVKVNWSCTESLFVYMYTYYRQQHFFVCYYLLLAFSRLRCR